MKFDFNMNSKFCLTHDFTQLMETLSCGTSSGCSVINHVLCNLPQRILSTVFWILLYQAINLFTIRENFYNRKYKNVKNLFCIVLKSTYYTSLKKPWMKGVSPVLQKLIRSNKACGPFQQKLTTSFDKTGLTEINF